MTRLLFEWRTPIESRQEMVMISDRDARELMAMQEQDSQVFESVITRIYGNVLLPGDTCLDGGAAKGLHTLPMARAVGTQGRVVAVEAIPTVARALRALVEEKRLTQVSVVQKALYHRAGIVQFSVVQNAPSRSGIARTSYPVEPDIATITVETVLVDELLADVDGWRFGKLDIEGAEFRALQGARRAIAEHSPFLVFERSLAAPTWYGYAPAEFFEFFQGLGYAMFDLFGRKLTPTDWHVAGRPWYALGVRSQSPDESFVRDDLPRILIEHLEANRAGGAPFPSSRAQSGAPFIWATPNPVPGGDGAGTTMVHWDTRSATGEVSISVNGDEERLFFRSPKGSRSAPWINAWGTYEFRLYVDSGRSELLDQVSVTRRKH
jgi:FkbM family methyltransferase